MPYYDYQCSACSEHFEKKLHIEDRKGPECEPCPSCGAPKTVLLVLGPTPWGDPVRLGVKRPDDTWKEVLREVDRKNAGSLIKDSSRYL
jgi:putative FmdB family regulatory protein